MTLIRLESLKGWGVAVRMRMASEMGARARSAGCSGSVSCTRG